MALRTDTPLVGPDDELRAAVEHERTVLLSFYETGIYAYQGPYDPSLFPGNTFVPIPV
jgi:hypothetical protein